MKNKSNTNVKISTILGEDFVMNGDFCAAGSVRIDGTINGNVVVKGLLILGVRGSINGDIQAGGAFVGGRVNGNIDAPDKLEMSASARVIGDVKTQVLVVDEKAVFQGHCDMYQETQSAKKGTAKPGIKVSRSGRKSAKAAIAEALKEVEEENRSQEAAEAPTQEKATDIQTEENVAAKAEQAEEKKEI